MTREEQERTLAEFYAHKKNIMRLKAGDYANEDVLSNFKSAGYNSGLSAEQQCLSLIATKVARLGNLLSSNLPNGKPNNESIEDSILDLSNYTDLLYCLRQEKKEQENQEHKPEQRRILKQMYNDEVIADNRKGILDSLKKNDYDNKVKDVMSFFDDLVINLETPSYKAGDEIRVNGYTDKIENITKHFIYTNKESYTINRFEELLNNNRIKIIK